METWGDRAQLLKDLAVQDGPPAGPELPGQEEALWTAHARGARIRDEMYLLESRYDAAGRPLTVAVIPHPEDPGEERTLITAGDVDSPAMRVLGHYDSADDAIAALPPPVQPGVLYPGGNPLVPSTVLPSIAELIKDVSNARHSGDVAQALDRVTGRGFEQGHLAHLNDLLRSCSSFAGALDTIAGRDLAVRLRMLSAQLDALDRELVQVRDDLEETVAVLPPYRTPAPRHINPPKPPGLRTTPPPAAQATPPRVPHLR